MRKKGLGGSGAPTRWCRFLTLFVVFNDNIHKIVVGNLSSSLIISQKESNCVSWITYIKYWISNFREAKIRYTFNYYVRHPICPLPDLPSDIHNFKNIHISALAFNLLGVSWYGQVHRYFNRFVCISLCTISALMTRKLSNFMRPYSSTH